MDGFPKEMQALPVYVRLSVSTLLVLATILSVARESVVADERGDFFELKIRPVLADVCFRCHDERQKAGGLRVDSLAAILEGGDSGPAIVPGAPEKSLLLKAIRRDSDVSAMPPEKERALRADQLEDFVRWVKDGAVWPAGTASFSPRRHWAFEPLASSAPPVVADPHWTRTRIDGFIRQRQASVGAAPLPPGDQVALVRRVTFDLTGLPPSPDAVTEFLADQSPDAFERLVDRLLASPAYGERWGRHWLDVVRYADTAGETADYPTPFAWRYRNYVIDAFNRDKPYDEFLREQVAGDILARSVTGGEYADKVIATGFLAISRRFGFDSENYHHLTIQDSIDTLGQTFLGLSLGCARCHDHKFDPVSIEDYYALYGIFASSRYPFPGSEQKQKVRSLAPLVPPQESKTLWDAFVTQSGQLSHELARHQQAPPMVILRSLNDLDGDFELQAPAAGGSYGVLVPPWLYEGPISVTAAAQSPFKNVYATGRYGASIPAGTSAYRFFQAWNIEQLSDDGPQLHFNLDFRLTPQSNPAPAAQPGTHTIALGPVDGSVALEWVIRGDNLELRVGGESHAIGQFPASHWINLQWTVDHARATMSGRFGRPGEVHEFGPFAIPASVLPPPVTKSASFAPPVAEAASFGPPVAEAASFGANTKSAWRRIEFRGHTARSVDSATRRDGIEFDNLAIRWRPIAAVAEEPVAEEPVAEEPVADAPAAGAPFPADTRAVVLALRRAAQWRAELRELQGYDGDLELQPRDKSPVSPWNPGPQSVVTVSAAAQSPFQNIHDRGEQGLRMPNRREYDGFGLTLKDVAPAANGQLHVSFDFRCVDAAAGGDGSWRYYIGHGAGPRPAVELYWNAREFFRRGGDSVEAVTTLTPGRWYQARLSIDVPRRTYQGVLAWEEGSHAFSGQTASAWDGIIDYTFIDSYGHLPGVRPSLDADNFVVRAQPLPPISPNGIAGGIQGEKSQEATESARRLARRAELQDLLARHDAHLEIQARELSTQLVHGPFPMAYAMSEGTPHDVRIQLRGEPAQPGKEVPRGFPRALGGQPLNSTAATGSGRLELARWLTDNQRSLVARVIANRVWQYHFGQGLVVTPNDFGIRGQLPTHPELLDQLAQELIDHHWSLKSLHRQIVLSATYQQGSPANADSPGRADQPEVTPATSSVDSRSQYVGFARRRLSAEEIRDAILLVTGELDTRTYREHPFPSPLAWGFTQHAPFHAVYDHSCRGVYLMTQRLKRHPFLALFDGADPNASTATRAATTVPTQALYFLNDPFVHRAADRWAERLLREENDDPSRLDRAWRTAIGRQPTVQEQTDAGEFLRVYREELTAAGQSASSQAASSQAAWAAYLRSLLGSNEFLHVE